MFNLNILAEDGEAVYVRCVGNLDEQPLLAEVNPLVRLLGPTVFERRVRLNLERVEFLDSRGIGWLVECHKRFRQGGGALSLYRLPPRILQVLRFCSMDRYFHLIREETGDSSRALPEADSI